MFILGIEFLALIIICYIYYVCATQNQVSGNKKKKISKGFVLIAILMFSVMVMFASWYIELGLAS